MEVVYGLYASERIVDLLWGLLSSGDFDDFAVFDLEPCHSFKWLHHRAKRAIVSRKLHSLGNSIGESRSCIRNLDINDLNLGGKRRDVMGKS